jgi:hypothetical protein
MKRLTSSRLVAGAVLIPLLATACSGSHSPSTVAANGAANPGPTASSSVSTCPSAPPSGSALAGESTPPYATDLQAGTAASDLSSSLSTLTASTDDLMSQPASQLGNAISSLAPAPLSSLEALARIAYSGTDVAGDLSSIDKEAQLRCGTSLFGDTSNLDQIGPRRSGNGDVEGYDGTFGRCSQNGIANGDGFVPPFTFVSFCGHTDIQVNLETGSVAQSGPDLPNADDVSLVDGDATWIATQTKPAHGLHRASTVGTLHVADLAGKQLFERRLYSVPGTRGLDAAIYPSSGSDVLVSVYNRRVELTLYSIPSGTEVFTTNQVNSDPRDSEQLTDNTVALADDGNTPDGVIDVAGDQLVAPNTADTVGDQGCFAYAAAVPLQGFFSDGPTPHGQFISDVDGRVGLTQLSTRITDVYGSSNSLLGATKSGLIFGHAGVTAYSTSGVRLWRIPGNVAHDGVVAAGWVVAKNESGERLIIDPATGKLAKGLSSSVRSTILALANQEQENDGESDVAMADAASDSLVYYTSSDSVARTSFRAVCR